MRFKIYRDGDAMMGFIPRLRKVVIELWQGTILLDRQRTFTGPLLKYRLRIWKWFMLRRGAVFLEQSGDS